MLAPGPADDVSSPLQHHLHNQPLHLYDGCYFMAIYTPVIVDDRNTYASLYPSQASDDQTRTLTYIYTSGKYVWFKHILMPSGPTSRFQPTPSPAPFSDPPQCDGPPIVDSTDSISATVDIQDFKASHFTCLDISLTFDQITDVRLPLRHMERAHFRKLEDCFHSHCFDYSRVLFAVTS